MHQLRRDQRLQLISTVHEPHRSAANCLTRRWLEQLDRAVDWLNDRASNGATDPAAYWPTVSALQRDALLFGDLKLRSSLQRIAEVLGHFCGGSMDARDTAHSPYDAASACQTAGREVIGAFLRGEVIPDVHQFAALSEALALATESLNREGRCIGGNCLGYSWADFDRTPALG